MIISPAHLRRIGAPAVAARSTVRPPWLVALYADLARRLRPGGCDLLATLRASSAGPRDRPR